MAVDRLTGRENIPGLIHKGPHQMVDFISGTAASMCTENSVVQRVKVEKRNNSLLSFFGGGKSGLDAAAAGYIFAHYVVQHGLIGEEDLRPIPQGRSDSDKLKAANLAGAVFYEANEYGKKLGMYATGLILADLFNILPVNEAAKLELAISDPDVTEHIKNGNGAKALTGVDLQPSSVEIFYLLPEISTSGNSRESLLAEMARLDKNGALRLVQRIRMNWGQNNSPFGAYKIANASLNGTQAHELIRELPQQFDKWKQIIG